VVQYISSVNSEQSTDQKYIDHGRDRDGDATETLCRNDANADELSINDDELVNLLRHQ